MIIYRCDVQRNVYRNVSALNEKDYSPYYYLNKKLWVWICKLWKQ